ncbi:hypothetical protein [Streptomyces sp. NPDC058084]|uniref:hypothetical protein n=1 Tax=Streptomyces sp. NPDC058084 TaxID=3346333 RepID=UPI0036E81C3E
MPTDLEMEIVKLLYDEAEDVAWTYLPGAQHTDFYHRWADDPRIGGRMSLFFKTAQERRVWIKDGPMKEYARAIYGVGKYAPLVRNPGAAVSTLVHKALGPDWEPDLSTQEIKPLRVLARAGDEDMRFTWGPAKDLKHLVWAALRAQAAGDTTPWTLCVVTSFVKPLPVEEKKEHLRIGERCGLRIEHVVGA